MSNSIFFTRAEINHISTHEYTILQSPTNYNYYVRKFSINTDIFSFPFQISNNGYLLKYPFLDYEVLDFYNIFIVQIKNFLDAPEYITIDLIIDIKDFNICPDIISSFLDLLEKENIGYILTKINVKEKFVLTPNYLKIQIITKSNLYEENFYKILQKHWNILLEKQEDFAKLYFDFLMKK